MKWTIDYLRKSGLIAYEYRRGSHMYHLNTPTSDEDTGGVFICPPEMLEGLRSQYVEQVADEKNDTVFYEFGRWVELLIKSNPTALESLFAPEDCIIGPVHPAVQFILDHRDMFLSKECFKTFYGYAVSQIGKARGLNKKIVNPVTERKDILDFCYTFKNQGSYPIKDWLKDHKLDQKYCGLVNIPNMRDMYGVYYDFAAYFKFEGIDSALDKTISTETFLLFKQGCLIEISSAILVLFIQTKSPSPTRFVCAQSPRARSQFASCTTTRMRTPATVVTTKSIRSGRKSVTLFATKETSATITTVRT